MSTSARTRSCAVCSQRSCSSVSRCSQIIRPRDTAPGGPSLAAGAATHPVQTVRADVSLPQRSSATIPTWQSWQRPSAALPVVACGRRHLPISSCQLHCSTIGDHTFAVAGPRAWNSLPPAVRSSATYNIPKDLKSHLLDYPTHRDNIVFIDYVQCPCSSSYHLYTALYKSSDLHYITSGHPSPDLILYGTCGICANKVVL